MTISEAGRRLRARQLSCLELTRECLRRCHERNPELNAFITVTEESAIEQAKSLDQELAAGRDRGPMHGIPIAHKDLFRAKGVLTTAGSALRRNYVPEYNAAVVEQLTEAGAISLGKTNLHELAYGITSENAHFGDVHNPHGAQRIAGGSSGGSAVAVAAGMVLGATGTDTGGSIRIPAAFCGVTGLKPTYGRVSRFGTIPLSFTLDHMGPIAGSAEDAALMLQAMCGYDKRDSSCSTRPVPDYAAALQTPIAGLRVGVPDAFFFDSVSAESARAVERSIERMRVLGASIVPVHLPNIEELNLAARLILLVEAAALYRTAIERGETISPGVRRLLDQGRLVPATSYVDAQRLRQRMARAFTQAMKIADCLFTPAVPFGAPLLGQTEVEIDGVASEVRIAVTRLVRPFNLLGWPAASVPCGLDKDGMPLGIQIVAPPFQEATVLRAAFALEEAG